MLVPNQLIEITIMGNNMQHYLNLGYDVKFKDVIHVPPEHLTDSSHKMVNVQCDICGKITPKTYQQYLLQHTYSIDTCVECKNIKTKQTCLSQYGVEHPLQVPEIYENARQSFLKKHGYVSNLCDPKIRKQITETFIEKYGVDNPMKNKKIKEKLKQTFINKYGCDNPQQNQEIKRKTLETMYRNGTTPTSQQQIQLHKMVQQKYPSAELNYPFSLCSLDIFVCINDIKIDIEYDGWYWHQDKHKDLKRDKYLQSKNFKILRIRSGTQLPTEQELFEAIDYLVNTEHHFKEIILSDWKEGEECQEQSQVIA